MRLFILMISLFFMTTTTLFDFNTTSDISNWRVVDDVVMGGRSSGNFKINTDIDAAFPGFRTGRRESDKSGNEIHYTRKQ